MKTKQKILSVCSIILMGIFSSYGQFNLDNTAPNNTLAGNRNTFVGYLAGATALAANPPSSLFAYNTFVGYQAGNKINTTSLYVSNNTLIGNGAGGNSLGGLNNVYIGVQSGLNSHTSFDPNISGGTDYGRSNTCVGNAAGFNNQGSGNAMFGNSTGQNITTGSFNTFLGGGASANATGTYNISIGYGAGGSNTSGSNNIIVGASGPLGGNDNIVFGRNSGAKVSGNKNLLLGFQCGETIGTNNLTGSSNVYIGYVQVPNTIKTTFVNGYDASNNIILADQDFNQRLFINNNGYTGIGLGNNNIAQNMLELNGGLANTSGLRFRTYTNSSTAITNPTNKVLTVNSTGDVILVNGGATNSCNTNFFVPVSNSSGNLSCSQIYDNGTSVGIGTTGSFAYTWAGGLTGTNLPGSAGNPGLTGNVKLDVNGMVRGFAFMATSDKKFKKEIKPITKALSTIQAIDGKTYKWNKEANKEMNFDDGNHSGFIAQELEKVLPHLVVTGKNGDKAVNYMELIPYLVEAIKEQQTQISDLKAQITENFKAQNQDLIKLENTKIISVSPNPSKDNITISFNIEKEVQSAILNVHDLDGNIINSLVIKERDNNLTRNIQKENFGKGIYIVSLVINGKSVDTKKIIFE